ncbi:hypothetical protein [Mesorhizobium amorphae]|uniref:hypothetical protein n=1 Tax=Mesorhizobium amorphae TaxID=71433 RepID=UPI001184A7AC|nr:hypothetical protein [Mesorhizobium amorphae]
MSTYSNEQIGNEAIRLANEIEALCHGRPTASVYLAISMMLGGTAAAAPSPDFEGMMALVERTAFHEFKRHVERGAH